MGKLNHRSIATLPNGRHGDGNGLCLNVGNGGRSWVYRYRWQGRRVELGLGSAADVSLSVARDILSAGQKEIFGDATSLALHYISTPGTSPSELQPACWVIRDFGTDEQFSRFISEIRKSQYRRYRAGTSDTVGPGQIASLAAGLLAGVY